MAINSVLAGAFVLVVVLVAASFLAYQFLRRRLAARHDQLTDELSKSAHRAEERAHNQLVLCEAELKTLQRDGVPIDGPAHRLTEARAAFARKDYYQAYQISKSVHDAFVSARAGGPVTPAAPGRTGAFDPFDGGVGSSFAGAGPGSPWAGPELAGSAGAGPGPEVPRPAAPKNRMEAHFQITLLREELGRSIRADPKGPGVDAANRSAAAAQSAFDQGDYTEALRLALRTRRALGGHVEALAPTVPEAPGGSATVADAAPGRIGPSGPAAGAAPGATCRSCQKPLRPGDKFCRLCGATVGASACPRCGAPREGSDRFCGVCGAPTA